MVDTLQENVVTQLCSSDLEYLVVGNYKLLTLYISELQKSLKIITSYGILNLMLIFPFKNSKNLKYIYDICDW